MANHRLGGEDRRVAPGGSGSSPDGSIWPATNNKKVLREMLKTRDRYLSWWDRLEHKYRWPEKIKMDQERKLIREKLKSLGRKNV